MEEGKASTSDYPPPNFKLVVQDLDIIAPGIDEKCEIKISKLKEKELVYEFELTWKSDTRPYRWQISRSFDELQHLHRHISKQKSLLSTALPKFPSTRELSHMKPQERLLALSKYLQSISEIDWVVKDNKFLIFIEVSMHSFSDNGNKFMEGFVKKRTGGRVSSESRCCYWGKCSRSWQIRWLIIREDYFGYMTTNSSTRLHESLMFKGRFEWLSGKKATGYKDGIVIQTTQRRLLFRAGNEYRRDKWVDAIQTAYSSSAWNIYDEKFMSSFPQRNLNSAQWYVDGEDYFAAVYEQLNAAQYKVLITDWWLSPELYLLRPPAAHQDSRLVDLLGKIANRGVKVFVAVYREVALALTINSKHTEEALLNASSNIKIVRHPHRSLRGGQFLWSHHEKIVCIDGHTAFLGGLDLWYGRWDNKNYSLTDNGEIEYWPGIDYSNVRRQDFYDVHTEYARDSINRKEIPRMPWHDIAMKVTGKAAYDVSIHFIELWNHAMTDIAGDLYKNKQLLAPVQKQRASRTNKTVAKTICVTHTPTKQEPQHEEKKKHAVDVGMLRHSVVQHINHVSVSKYMPTRQEDEIHDFAEPRSPVQEEVAEMPIVQKEGSNLAQLLGNNLISEQLNVLGLGSSIPSEHKARMSQHVEERNRHATHIEERENSCEKRLTASFKLADEIFASNLIKPLAASSVGDFHIRGSNQCQLVRSAGWWSHGLDDTEFSIWNAYVQLISQANHFIYIENQFFISNTAGEPVKNPIAQVLVDRIINAAQSGQKFKVIVVMPLLPAFEGAIDDPEAQVLRVQLHWEYETISRGANSIYKQLEAEPSIENPYDYIKFYGLRTHGVLNETPVTEMVYVHSKLMIVDDDVVIMGSANINDRSMVGRCDSEIAMVVRDSDKVQTTMNGQEMEVGKFARSLRLNIFGILSGFEEDSRLIDPLDDSFKEIWENTAYRNTAQYRSVFACYPDNYINKASDLATFESKARLDWYDDLVAEVKGYIVDFPLEFLSQEDLTIQVFTKEWVLPAESFI